MKMKFLFLLFLIGYGLIATAQSIDEIKNDRDCFYGEGEGRSFEEADRMALDQLMQKVFVKADYPFERFEYDERNFLYFYRNAFDEESEKMFIEEKESFYKVCRFIHKNDVAQIFESREKKVKEYCQRANNAETELRIDDALRDLYWAYSLLFTLPESKRDALNDGEHQLIAWIPEKLEEIFANIEIKKLKEAGEHIILIFTYKGQAVTSLCYSYFNGMNYTQLHKATDGLGVVQLLPGYALDTVMLKVEYQFHERARLDQEIEAAFTCVSSKSFRVAMHCVAINVSDSDDISFQLLTNQLAGWDMGNLGEKERKPYEKTIQRLIQCLKSNDLRQAEGCFSSQSEDLFKSFKYMGKIHIIDEPRLCYLPMGEAVLCLGLPVFVEVPRQGPCFVEYLSFILDPDAKIRRFAFGIDQKTMVELLGNENYLPSLRLAILNLLETFKTAYPLMQFDFIEKLINEAPASSTVPIVDTTCLYPFVIYQKQVESNEIVQNRKTSSHEYLQRLRKCFMCKDFVESDLRNISVMKMAKGGELYGVQFDVEYSSPNYSDSGNLLLLLDLNDPDKIQIKYYLWQDESFRCSLTTEGLIRPINFY